MASGPVSSNVAADVAVTYMQAALWVLRSPRDYGVEGLLTMII